MLTACEGSIGQIEPPKLAPPPPRLLEECIDPVTLPEREITQAEVETFWVTDRTNLRNCKDLKAELQRFYQRRDLLVTGGKKVE